MINSIKQLDLNKRYSYADYLTWQFDEMVEIIRGKVFKMSPAPSRKHQEISGALYLSIGNYLQKKSCKVYHAPFDVRIPLPDHQQSAEKIDTVVQPDISVICDFQKLDVHGCQGAPDWIIEILSESTAQKDLNEKFQLYQNAQVKEYWIVHPQEETVLVYLLNESCMYELRRLTPYVKGEKIPVGIFGDFEVDLGVVFG